MCNNYFQVYRIHIEQSYSYFFVLGLAELVTGSTTVGNIDFTKFEQITVLDALRQAGVDAPDDLNSDGTCASL